MDDSPTPLDYLLTTPHHTTEQENTMTNADLARLTELALMIADTDDDDTRD